jgi:hypothetical protein
MQSFILDRHTDPSNPVMKVTQDDKIPVYDSLADAQADIANLEENQIGMTKDSGAEPDIKEYIRNQNILDDWEAISISTDSNNPTVIPYDGFIDVVCQGGNLTGTIIYINGDIRSDFYIVFNGLSAAGNNYAVTHSLPVAKGDIIYRSGSLGIFTSIVRYYKLRDYTGR